MPHFSPFSHHPNTTKTKLTNSFLASSLFLSLSLSLSLSNTHSLTLSRFSNSRETMIGEYQSSSSSSSPFKDQARLVKPSMCLSSCFSTGSTVRHEVLIENDEDRVRSPRSPCAWLKSTAQELPEIRDRCWNLISRFRRSRRQHHNSSDFSYDLSSYALNFEDEYSRDDESFPFRNFSSRLPVSPPPQPASAKYVSGCAAVRREIVGFS